MLQLRHISKTYCVGGNETRALADVSVSFRRREFVAVLGMSGSGKTTFLNIIGGLDRYDTGALIIKGKNTEHFADGDWDAYRNNSIGFVFQTYNLIMHLSIIDNVEIGMTLSGVGAREKRRRALEVLRQVGLGEHLHKKPNQLSGGQMQRVAIARALANDPEILLCDEPTGALDTTTSRQIMDLIHAVAGDRLVIMVTHNAAIADTYADRILRFEDGRIIADSNPCPVEDAAQDPFSLTKTSMRYATALKLSYRNLRTKGGRTLLTAIASSIGIVGIAVILSLSTGFQTTIDDFQRDTLSEFPVIITRTAASINTENIATLQTQLRQEGTGSERFAPTDVVYLHDPSEFQITHTNRLTDEYLAYLQAIDPAICGSIGYTRIVSLNMLREVDGAAIPVSASDLLTTISTTGMSGMASVLSGGLASMGLSSYPTQLAPGTPSYLESHYDVLHGRYPQADTELVLIIDSRNRIDIQTFGALGFDTDGVEAVALAEIVGTEFTLVSNDNFYRQTELKSFLPSFDYVGMLQAGGNLTARIVGVLRQKETTTLGLLATGIAYSDALAQRIIDRAADSQIVRAQRETDRNVMTMEEMTPEVRDMFLSYLGGNATPFMIMLYPKNFETKTAVIAYLDAYNDGKPAQDQVFYTDMAGMVSNMTGGIMEGITIVLIAFASISLVVSLIMIAIITYTSVLERTKEIGILRSMGARRKDITRVFDAETAILGVFSGLLGVCAGWLLTYPINALLYDMAELTGVARLQPMHAVLLVLAGTALTIAGGHIPARMASRRDVVAALRSE